jgi:hypothetical protein
MITIEGLTKKQRAIMEILWHCDSLAQAELFIKSMPTHKDRCDAHSLMMLALYESLEEKGGLDEWADMASEWIATL